MSRILHKVRLCAETVWQTRIYHGVHQPFKRGGRADPKDREWEWLKKGDGKVWNQKPA